LRVQSSQGPILPDMNLGKLGNRRLRSLAMACLTCDRRHSGREENVVGSPHRAQHLPISLFRVYPLIEIRRAHPCRASRANSRQRCRGQLRLPPPLPQRSLRRRGVGGSDARVPRLAAACRRDAGPEPLPGRPLWGLFTLTGCGFAGETLLERSSFMDIRSDVADNSGVFTDVSSILTDCYQYN